MLLRSFFLAFFVVLVTAMVRGQGDNCAAAINLSVNGSYQSDGPASGNGCVWCIQSTHADWFRFYSPQIGVLNVNSCRILGPKTRLFLSKGSCNSLELLAADSTGCGLSNGSAIVSFVTEAQTDYFLEWDDLYGPDPFEFEFEYNAAVGCNSPLNNVPDSVTHNFARITWTSPNAPSNYALEYGPTGFVPGNGIVINGSAQSANASANIPGLSPNTLYDYYLSETCTGLQSDPVTGSFKTREVCNAPSSFLFLEDSLAPDFVRIDWSTVNSNATFYLGYSKAPLDPNAMVIVSGDVGVVGPPIEISGLEDNMTYEYQYWEVCPLGSGDTVNGMFFSTPKWCEGPTLFGAQQTTGNSAVLNWISQNSSGSYFVEYGEKGFSLGSGTVISGPVGSQPVNLSGLSPNTVYDAYLFERCGNGYSSETIMTSFNTFSGTPLNDFCAEAISISCGETYAASTALATQDDTPTQACFVGAQGAGVWYSYTGNNQEVTLSLCGSEFDTQVLVFAGSCTNYTCVAGNDDYSGCSDFQSLVAFDAISGTRYLIFVGGFEGERGVLSLNVSCKELCLPKPLNDNCNQALTLELGAPNCTGATLSNTCATSGWVNDCNEFGSLVDVWFQFNTGNLDVISLFFNFELGQVPGLSFALYAGCSQNQYLGCGLADNGFDIPFELTPNTDYWLQVWTEFGNEGLFDLCVREYDPESISERWSHEFGLHPNPSSDEVFIQVEVPAMVELLDVRGRKVLSISSAEVINTRGIPRGVYFVRIEGYSTQKLIVQ